MKKMMAITLAGVLAVTLAACGNSASNNTNDTNTDEVSTQDSGTADETDGGNDSGDAYNIKLTTVLNDGDPLAQGLYWMADELKERSGGRLTADVLTGGLAGDVGDVLDQVRMGANSAIVVDAGRISDYVPNMAIFDGPYLFEDYEEASKFTETDMFNGWLDQAMEQGIHISSWNWYQGARHIWVDKEVNTMSDLKGLKIRTGDSPIWQDILKSFGAVPVNLPGSEVYQSIQQKVIDGMEGQTSAGYSAKGYEVAPYLMKTSHFQLLTGLAISESWYQSLPGDLQEIFDEVSKEAGEKASQETIENESVYEEEMQAQGLNIITPDLTEFKDAADAVYDNFDGYRELKEEIQKAIKE